MTNKKVEILMIEPIRFNGKNTHIDFRGITYQELVQQKEYN